MSITQYETEVAIGLFVAMVALSEIGRRYALRQMARDPDGARTGTAVIEGAVFALLGLLIAFTFGGAAGRFDNRRAQIIDEVNAIGTAWLRLDLLPADKRDELRKRFCDNIDARIAIHHTAGSTDRAAIDQKLLDVGKIQEGIWKTALDAVADDPRPQVATLVLPALNQMFDIGSTRVYTMTYHVSPIVVDLLLAIAGLSSLLAGYAMATAKGHHWLHAFAFPLMISITVFVTLELEYPRAGFLRMDVYDTPMLKLQESMHQAIGTPTPQLEDASVTPRRSANSLGRLAAKSRRQMETASSLLAAARRNAVARRAWDA